jgi:hypothetical protein
VVKCRRNHMIWEDIANACEAEFGYRVTVNQLAEYFRVLMRARNKELHQDIDAVREMSIEQLNKAAAAILPKVEAGHLDAIESYIKIQNRISKLIGLDAPVQREDVTPRQRLTADELINKMAEITTRLKAARELARPVIDVSTVPEPPEPVKVSDAE